MFSSNFKSDPPSCKIASTKELNSCPPGIPVNIIPESAPSSERVKDNGLRAPGTFSISTKFN